MVKQIGLLVTFVICILMASCVFSINDDYNRTWDSGGGNVGEGDFIVSGVIIDISGEGVPGVVVSLSGSNAEADTTDADGAYQFENIASGSYTVMPPETKYAPMPINVTDGDYFVGYVRSGGHGGNKNGNYSCTNCH